MIVVPPALEERGEVRYVAQPRSVTMRELGDAIPQGFGAVMEWMVSQGIEPSGPPLIRYRVIDMDSELQVEIGWPVAEPVVAGPDLISDSLPAGTYGVVTYSNPEEGIAGNGELIQWARDNGIEWASSAADAGEAFVSRVEFELTDPDEQPDRLQWQTEVAILVKGTAN
ncbi:MAG: hypothetical protein CVT64_11095 [Actinobacteria bacterium HGW-Actinobacteria-4]|nr:MAG: hypothetical protein CVT64_11095 [Actinobacteria bacterium HGW-Actinobacteria-4]